jgi:SHS2 domain-containing protein
MEKFKFIDSITSDVLYEAYGKDLKELFENSAAALSSVICKIDQIEPAKQIDIALKGEDLDELMINWLQYLIAIVDTEEMFLSKFEIKEINETSLKAVAYGESITPEKGETVVKAVTYYKFKLEQDKKGAFKVTVSLDI